MMLFKLSVKNIRKSMKDYAIYFFTLILGVAIFYVFNAIESQTVLLNITDSTQKIIEVMTNILSGVSVFVSFVLGFLIIYANRFLMKRRNKEFGVYLTLGMGKRKISLILFFETILIGIISLIMGLLLGIILSQFMSLLVANMFEADMTKFAFTFSNQAMIKTLIYFGIMYVLVMIFNTKQVSRCKLIDLLNAGKKSEKIKMKNSFLCSIVFIISCVILGYAYYQVTEDVDSMQDAWEIYIPIILGALSTFFIFWSISGLMLKIIMSAKSIYYKGLNSYILRQISSKINTTVFSMTTICLMLFLTICVLSSALSIKNSMNNNIKELAPMDIQMSRTYGLNGVDEDIRQLLTNYGFDIEEKLTDILTFDTYMFDDITFETTLGSKADEIKKDYKFLTYSSWEEFIRLSDYNRLAELYGMKTYSLEENEYMVVADYDNIVKIRNIALRNGEHIRIGGVEYHPKYTKCKNGVLTMSGNHTNAGYFVVPDSVKFDEDNKINYLVANYNTTDKNKKNIIEEELSLFLENRLWNDNNLSINYNSLLDIKTASIGLGAMVTFIGLYLGIIFLISSAAILALKELSESTDNRERYNILRKIGTDEKAINRALFKQIGIFFLFPLLIAIIHSYFGIQFCNYILAAFGKSQMLNSVGITFIFLVTIYGGYFLLTYFCSKEIIKER